MLMKRRLLETVESDKISIVIGCVCLFALLFNPSTLPAQDFPTTPLLRIETGMHTAQIRRIDVDARERFLVSGSDDKSVRVWDVGTGELLRTIRVPSAPDNVGKIYAVAISPDGAVVAAGGWTSPRGLNDVIYLFNRETGAIVHRITGLENVINHLAYSKDGRHLAAVLGGGNGLRVYKTDDYTLVKADRDYGTDSYWVDFDPSGRLVTTCYDNQLRLYDQRFNLLKTVQTLKKPFSAVFSADGQKIAVGYSDDTKVDVFSGETLERLYSPDTETVDNGDLSTVAWSQDGRFLFAGGRYIKAGDLPIRRWSERGRGTYIEITVSRGAVMDLVPLADGGLLVGAADPVIARLDREGNESWKRSANIADFRYQQGAGSIRLSESGDIVQFGFEPKNRRPTCPARFAMREGILEVDPPEDSTLYPARTQSPKLKITDWKSEYSPKLNGEALPLDQYETSRSLAIAPGGESFLLGTEWNLTLFDKAGKEIWKADAPPIAWSVNISRDGRFAVAAFADGTIRWYEMKSGKESLAFFPHRDGTRWIAWTPEGFFAASEGAESLIGYQLNNGADASPSFVSADQLYDTFYRPDLVVQRFEGNEEAIARALDRVGDIREVLARRNLPPTLAFDGKIPEVIESQSFNLSIVLTDQGGGFGRIEIRINGVLQPDLKTKTPKPQRGEGRISVPVQVNDGPNEIQLTAYNSKGDIASQPLRLLLDVDLPDKRPALYGLAVGIEKYRDRELELNHAVHDATEIVATLELYSKPLFTKIEILTLTDAQATLVGITDAFEELIGRIGRQDVFVLYLSGHGVALDGEYHFLPSDLIYTNDDALRENSLSEQLLTKLLRKVPAQKSLVILDTCHAGSFDLVPKLALKGPAEKTAISRLMKATGRAVLYASSEQRVALEGYKGHSLFTYVLLEGLKGEANRAGGDKQITINELAAYIEEKVPKLSRSEFGYEMFPMQDMQGHSFPITLIQ